MSTGDQADFVTRIARELPKRWFGDASPVLSGALAAFANVGAACYAMVQFARAQMRLGTMSGGWLDLFALDYFGTEFPRRGKSDDRYRTAIKAELLRERVTRAGIAKALFDLTGRAPRIVEPWNPNDTGAYGSPRTAYAGGVPYPTRVTGYGGTVGGYGRGRIGYGLRAQAAGTSVGAGVYGSLSYPFQIFVTAYRPAPVTIANRPGYGTPRAGYGQARTSYADLSEIAGPVTDAEILACVARNTAAGITAWVRITD